MGDLLTFSMKLVHASLDNQSDAIRISTDTRYQLASEPTDDRWVGPAPRGHVGFHKRGSRLLASMDHLSRLRPRQIYAALEKAPIAWIPLGGDRVARLACTCRAGCPHIIRAVQARRRGDRRE